ncbi:MAG: HlyD family secretion protein [Pseudomonadota bacterium]
MRFALLVCLLVGVVLFTWHLVADRVTPFTTQARVKMVVIPIVPEVSGPVAAVAVTENQLVEPGDVLLTIDAEPYRIAVARAEASLQGAVQEVGADSAGIETAQARLSQATIDLDNVRAQSARIFELEKKGFYAVAKADDARAELAEAEAELNAAEAELERERAALGADDERNPRIAAALADLEQARLDLERTTLSAPTAGAALGQDVEIGLYARAGQPLMTFLSSEALWIEAYMTENNLGLVRVGQPAEIVLDMYPGQVFGGVVAGFSGAVSIGRDDDAAGELPTAQKSSGWLREAQRFPLIVRFADQDRAWVGNERRTQLNGQADVMVYTGGNGFLNMLGRFWVRLHAWMSYAY